MDSDSSQFSQREKEVIELLMQGKSNKQIALALDVSTSTVEYHLRNIYRKLQVSSRTEAVLRLGKSIGSEIHGVLGKSGVEMEGASTENGRKAISTRRFPMNKKFYKVGGGLLAIALVVGLILVGLSIQNANRASRTQVSLTAGSTSIPAETQTDSASPVPTLTETSIPPFAYTVVGGDTCLSISLAFGVSVSSIMDENNLSSSCVIHTGQVLFIPYSGIPLSPGNAESNDPPIQFFHEWVNVDLKNANIKHVSIQARDGATFINMFGACLPTDCDWRKFSPAPVIFYNYDSKTGILNVQWTFDFQILIQKLTIMSDGQLKVTTQNHYLDNSGRADFKKVEYFKQQ